MSTWAAPTVSQEIASAIRSTLAALLPTGTAVYADGVPETDLAAVDVDGNAVEKEWVLPAVVIGVSFPNPYQYKSSLLGYPLDVKVVSHYSQDRFQQTLYALADPVSQWLCDPSLSLTLATFHALTISGPPERLFDGNLQAFQWKGEVKTQKLTTP